MPILYKQEDTGSFAISGFAVSSDPGRFTSTYGGNGGGSKRSAREQQDELNRVLGIDKSLSFSFPIKIGGVYLLVHLITSPNSFSRGLLETNTIPDNCGLLFVFDEIASRVFHTSGMKFDIDILAFNADCTLIAISPSTPPDDVNVIILPACKYVLEILGGEAARNNIQVGDFLYMSGILLEKSTSFVDTQLQGSSFTYDTINHESMKNEYPDKSKDIIFIRESLDAEDDNESSWCHQCSEGCNCVKNIQCSCDHDCLCPDVELVKNCLDDDIIFDVQKYIDSIDIWNAGADEVTNQGDFLQLGVVNTSSIKDPKTGKVNFGLLPAGDSAWITVTNPSSPLHGRPILVIKRPDGLVALAGGAGRRKEVEARRHIILTGTPHKTQRDRELDEEIDKTIEVNAPLIAAKKELHREARQRIKEAQDKVLSALNLDKPNKKELKDKRNDIQNYFEQAGIGTDEAKRITNTIVNQYLDAEKQIRQQALLKRQIEQIKIGKTLKEIEDGESAKTVEEVLSDAREAFNETNKDPVIMVIPSAEELQGKTAKEQEQIIQDHIENHIDQYDSQESFLPTSQQEKLPKIELGFTVKPLDAESLAQMQESVGYVRAYYSAIESTKELGKQISKLAARPLSPVTIADLKDSLEAAEIDMSFDELEEHTAASLEQWVNNNTVLAFYDAVGEHWNNDVSLAEVVNSKSRVDSSMQYHVNAGAVTALNALAKEHLGMQYDATKLVGDGSLELASAMLALDVRLKMEKQYGREGGHQKLDDVISSVREYNSTNQRETERLALARHVKLKEQMKEIIRQKAAGELVDRARVSQFELTNLLEQKKNLGTALGSLQTSATVYDWLTRFRGKVEGINDIVKINVGDRIEDAESLIARLKLFDPRRPIEYRIDDSDVNNIKVEVGLSSLSKLTTKTVESQKAVSKYEQIKTDMGGTSYDSDNNLVVDSYDVPFWKKSYIDDAGDLKEYKWRVEQRNDINWLLESTKQTSDNPIGVGGGIITRVTGAGKSNSAMGFFGNQLYRDPDYRGLIIVPRGRAQQWANEAQKFTDLDIQLIPGGSGKEKVEEALLQGKRGAITIMEHREAANSSDILHAAQSDPDLKSKFNGVVIDEPQELQSRTGGGDIGAAGKRIMKVPFQHKIGLTATPARKNPSEAYDLISWAAGKDKLGSRASFMRKWRGFGSGTNAQDTAINKAFFDTIKPYISGDRITTPNFKVKRFDNTVARTSTQVRQQKQIEQGSAALIIAERRKLVDAAMISPDHELRRNIPEGKDVRAVVGARATARARAMIVAEHQRNMSGGDWRENAKLLALRRNLDKAKDKKHVIFIDSAVQRQSMVDMFRDMGYKENQIKNIAATTTAISGKDMAARVSDFRTNPNSRIILIDSRSASGYNLQAANALHIVGNPKDGAEYLQSMGRVARAPREGDVSVMTYKYSDNISDLSAWGDIDTQLKVLQAASPALAGAA